VADRRDSTIDVTARKSLPKARIAHSHGERPQGDADDFGLTKQQLHELERRLKDARDPTRYMVVSRFGPGFVLYYNVSDNAFAMNEPRGGTLFKRRDAAIAVSRLLRPGIQVVRCTTKVRSGTRVPVLTAMWSVTKRSRK